MKYPASKERLYSIWKGMHERCDNPNNQRYADYGGRGICICVQKAWTRGGIFRKKHPTRSLRGVINVEISTISATVFVFFTASAWSRKYALSCYFIPVSTILQGMKVKYANGCSYLIIVCNR